MREGKRKLGFVPLAGVMCLLGVAGAANGALTTYSGNGATGFGNGGTVGNGSLSVTDSGGNITFSFAANGGTLFGNDLVIYIDSTAGGFADTSAFSDNGDGGRTAVSGYNSGMPSRTTVSFPTGFAADYALSVEDTYVGLFGLAAGGNNSLNFITGTGQGTEPDTVTIPIADLGITPGATINFVGSLISTSAYRSNETIGTSVTVPADGGGNAGFNNSQAFSTFDSYTTTPVPEPAGLMVALAAGSLLLTRRRALASK